MSKTRKTAIFVPVAIRILQIIEAECNTKQEEDLVLAILSQFLEVRKNIEDGYRGSQSNLLPR